MWPICCCLRAGLCGQRRPAGTSKPHEQRTSAGPQTASIPIASRQSTAASLQALVASVGRGLLLVVGRRGLLGVESPHFDVVFLVREVVEIVSQVVQLHNLSGLLSAAWINHVLVALVALDCWSTPMLQYVYRDRQTLQRVLCVTCDIVITLGTCVVIPCIIFVPFALAFHYDTATFSDEMLYNDSLFANLVLQNRAVFALSTVDGFTKLVPHFGILGGLRAVRGFLRPPVDADAVKRDHIKTIDPAASPSTMWLRVVQSTTRLKMVRRVKAMVMHWAHVVLVLLGGVIVAIHVHAHASNSWLSAGCHQRVHPWLVSTASCSILEFNCFREHALSPNETALDGLNQHAVLILILAHCPALVVPPVLGRLPNLIGWRSTTRRSSTGAGPRVWTRQCTRAWRTLPWCTPICRRCPRD
ncbi:hypothetical protein PINS_up017628 [Pythium insidiosum]|nr:hypothetical protein PINS_up017628 [Pythium insidiosum]